MVSLRHCLEDTISSYLDQRARETAPQLRTRSGAMARCSQFCTPTFRKQRKAANIPRREFLERGLQLSGNPLLGNPLVAQDQTIRIWQTSLNGNSYSWHYIWIPEDHEIISVSLVKSDVVSSGIGNGPSQIFYIKLFAFTIAKIVKALLQDS